MTQLPSNNNVALAQIGHYSIVSCIGRGGMGLVYLARDTRLDRQVAIKCLRTELFEPRYRERFKREALLLAKLNHPNIVQIYDYQETEDQLALVMEYVAGQNLQQHLREHIVPLTQRMQWLVQIAQGLAVAHDAGIIHRDLKADNILINKHKLAKITDLGIAKSQDLNATLTDHITGSYGSMSPEQAMGEELDNRSDLFSFGILAYQLLCGVHPFGDTHNKLQLMQRIISHPPIPPTKTNPDLPPEVVELLGQLLSKNPDSRPSNTHWVAAQCERLYQLISRDSGADIDTTQILSHAHTSHSGIRNSKHSQEHPTFETRLQKNKSTFDLTTYVRNNSISVALIGLSVVMVIGAIIWQLQPKQPKYVAVLPPQLTTEGMHESQQELVKGAVYDAIQQSVLQLDGYYLIPQNEIADINADNNKQGIETVRKATAADELITSTVQCKLESCTIVLSRLTPEKNIQDSRLRVLDTKTVDVLTDNYLSMAIMVQSNIGGLYSEKVGGAFYKIDEKEYAIFLEVNRNYRHKGASKELLDQLDKLQIITKRLPPVQALYSEMALDLHYETKNSALLAKISALLESDSENRTKITHLQNLFYLQAEEEKFSDAEKTIELIQTNNQSHALISELNAYLMMKKNSYAKAIEFYKSALLYKSTASNNYYLALAHSHAGQMNEAEQRLNVALNLSPDHYKSHSLKGAIALNAGNLKQAFASLQKAVDLQPDNTDNINNIGLCYLLMKDYTNAINMFSKAITLLPNNTAHILNKADAHDLAGDDDEARKNYLKIIDILKAEKTNSDNLIHLSQAHAHVGNYSDALKYLQQLEKADPQSYKTNYTAAITHTLAKNDASAILNVENSLSNGLNIIWFGFPWFDRLCEKEEFVALMRNHGEPERCTLHVTSK
jgi:serine/threonine-protein kinase